MKRHWIGPIIDFAVILLIAVLVWLYYRHRTFPVAARCSTFGPRFWTGSVDACILWPVTFSTSALLLLSPPRLIAAILVILQSITWLIYTVVMHARYGQTVGKVATKVRVTDFSTEGPISWGQAWLREGIPAVISVGILGYEVFGIVTGRFDPSAIATGKDLQTAGPFWLLFTLPLLWFLAEVITMLTNQKRRALHDFIASTVVIRTNVQDPGE